MGQTLTDEEDSMSKRNMTFLPLGAVILAALLTAACGSNSATSATTPAPQNGSVVAFGTDAPVCDVEAFIVTVNSASLVSSSSTGTNATLVASGTPATVDFARLVDFTNIINTASVAPGTYGSLQVNLGSAQLVYVDVTKTPPAPATMTANITATNPLTIPINPPLVVTSATTSGLTIDFNLRKSVVVDGSGQITGQVDPQFTVSANTNAGSTVGEATALYGITGTPVTTSSNPSFTGSFPLTVRDGTGQTLTVQVTSSTTFEGDSTTSLGTLNSGVFVEVDATVDTSGDIIAQTVDVEEAVSSGKSAFLGRIINVVRDTNTPANATSFTLLVGDEVPDMSGTVPLHSGINVTLNGSTIYFTNWQHWNRAAFTLSPKTIDVAEKVAVFGTVTAGSPPTMTAKVVFLRPRNVLGNYVSLITAGSDDKTGGFTMTPCGSLFGGKPITVLTYADTNFTNVAGLTALSPSPTIDVFGPIFYEQTSGTAPAANGAVWTAPTDVMQARGVHQLPN
jgi:hypothetical protein